MSIDITRFFPILYHNIKEFKEIISTENVDFNDADGELQDCVDNQFIMTSNEYGVDYRERLLGILADPETETLDFRRMRLINRISIQPPFTTIFLRERLDDIIGVGEYVLTIDYENYTIYIESVAQNQVYSHEIAVTMNMIKPANMVYINVPTIISPILVGETVSIANLIWNYKLGTTWNLGQKPFLSYTAEEVIKVATIPSVTTDCLVALSELVQTDVVKVLVNNTYEITEFVSKDITEDGQTIISYNVLPSSGIETITNIKLIDNEGTVYFDSNIYVPVEQEVVMKHTIKFKEG